MKVDAAFNEILSAGQARFATFAEIMLASHRQMARHLPTELFTDPARSLLLELFIAEESGVATSMGVACLAAGVPQTTALRWVDTLRDKGIVHTIADKTDWRRTLVRLTEATHAAMAAYLSSISPVPLTR